MVATEVADDWAERWRAFHKPLAITAPDGGTSFWLRPPWEKGGPGEFEVVIDPGQAFGTGAHPTTRLSLQLLLDLHDRGLSGGPLTDLGTGSAVLAIAAAKLGWGPVSGYDHEVAAIEAAIENAEVNSVELELERFDLKAGLPGIAPTVVANLTAPLLEVVAAQLDESNRPERMVCSGLLATERERVEAAFAPGRAGQQTFPDRRELGRAPAGGRPNDRCLRLRRRRPDRPPRTAGLAAGRGLHLRRRQRPLPVRHQDPRGADRPRR